MGVEDRPTDLPGGGYRLVVLGGGPAGMAAAREAARRGVRVALFLRDRAAELAPAPSSTEASPAAHPPLAEQIRRVFARTGLAGPAEPPNESNVDVHFGQPVFSGRRTLAVGGREFRFRKALIATGAGAAPANIDGAEQNLCLQRETLFELTELPQRLAVIGSGPEACQWAQDFGRFGSQVHLVDRAGSIFPEQDPDAARVIQARMEQDGIRLHLGCHELTIEPTGKLHGLMIEHRGEKEKLLVDQILLCGPRRPNTVGLGLETAGVAYTDRGIVVGDRLQTTNRRIFAAGEVCGAEFACLQAAEAAARLAVHNALSVCQRRLSRLAVPHCIHTHPQVARVGLTRAEATERRIEVDTHRVDLAEADESIRPSRREGFIAIHVRRQTGRIVGATVVAEDADELIAPLVQLMTRRWSLAALADVASCRPSRLELLVRLAARYAETRPASRWARTIHQWQAWLRG